MAGYDDYSKSNNALDAEARGKYPITKAVRLVSEATGCKIRESRSALETIGHCEYHHTSKEYNITHYYDVQRAVDLILHGDPDWTENRENEELEKQMRDTEREQANCQHELELVYRDRKKLDGGGKIFSHYRCPLCGKSPL